MRALLISAFVFSLVAVEGTKDYAEVAYKCPPENPGACACIEAYGKVFLQCTKLSNRQQLVDAFQKMSGYGITELQMKDSNVSHIPRDLFKESPVHRIRIKNSMMFYLFDRELERGADHLTEIVLDHVEFGGGLDWNVLENLKSLNTLSVSVSNVESVPYAASELELPLETVVLQNAFVNYVYDTAFQHLKDLKNLKLNKNLMEQYSRSMLPLPESGIQYIDLSHNKLKSLPSDAFDAMPDLHSLLLRGNKLAVLEKSYMQPIFSSLIYLDVTDNPLLCSCEMKWLITDSKPFHLLGECKTSSDPAASRNLKDLTDEDFRQCAK